MDYKFGKKKKIKIIYQISFFILFYLTIPEVLFCYFGLAFEFYNSNAIINLSQLY